MQPTQITKLRRAVMKLRLRRSGLKRRLRTIISGKMNEGGMTMSVLDDIKLLRVLAAEKDRKIMQLEGALASLQRDYEKQYEELTRLRVKVNELEHEKDK
jgi:hypothetical protein